MNYEDPFSFLFATLWEYLESHDEFANLVKEKNRIKLNESFKPLKETITESSVPEVVLMPAGKRFFEEAPCNGASIIQRIHCVITTGIRHTGRLFPVQWRIAQAIYDALNKSSNDIRSKTWKDEAIIKNIVLYELEEGLSYEEENRNLRGWAAILPLEVKLFLSNSLYGLE